MKEFFKKKNILIGIVILGLIIGGLFYFEGKKVGNRNSLKSEAGVNKCKNIPKLSDGAKKLVTKVIDGDTFLIEGGYSVRILGIDADERGYPCYDEAKRGLEELVLGKEVKLEIGKEDLDQYCRYLRYVFVNDKNVSLEMVKNGLAVARFSPEDIKYRKEITLAEKLARENKIGCKWGGAKIEREENLSWEKLVPEKLNVEVIGACLAGKYIGKEIIIEGKVVDTYRSLKSSTVFLNFEKPYPNQCFTAVIFRSNLYKFIQNPENYYLNKRVRVFGKIKEYQGRPEIILEDPSQIEVGK
jgi:micrococcal nuclease